MLPTQLSKNDYGHFGGIFITYDDVIHPRDVYGHICHEK